MELLYWHSLYCLRRFLLNGIVVHSSKSEQTRLQVWIVIRMSLAYVQVDRVHNSGRSGHDSPLIDAFEDEPERSGLLNNDTLNLASQSLRIGWEHCFISRQYTEWEHCFISRQYIEWEHCFISRLYIEWEHCFISRQYIEWEHCFISRQYIE